MIQPYFTFLELEIVASEGIDQHVRRIVSLIRTRLTLFNLSLFFSRCRFAATLFISLLLPLTMITPSGPTLPTSSSSSSPDPCSACSEGWNGGGGTNPRSLKEKGWGGSMI